MWRAIDEHGIVLDVVLQRHRDTEAAKSFFVRLLGEHNIPETIHTDKLWSYGAALRELPVLHGVEHGQGVSTARYNNLVEQSHRPTRRQERQQRGFKSRPRARGFLNLHARVTNLHHPARCTVPAHRRRHHQQQAFTLWREGKQQLATTAGATEVDPFTDARATRNLTPAWDKRQPYSEEKTTRLLGAADARMLTLLLCGHAGLRISETLALEWADVDLSARILVVRNGKGGKRRRGSTSHARS